jgi:hypothetical protein
MEFVKGKFPGQPEDRYQRALGKAGLGGGEIKALAAVAKAELAAPRSSGTIVRAENILKTAAQGQTKPLGGGVTETFVVEVDGVKGVFKKMSNRATQEVVAHEIDRALGFGVTPPTVFRTFDVGSGPEKGSVMHFVEGTVAAKFGGKFRSLDMAKITALDFVIGNQDRHPDNFIIDKNGKAWAIDNAFAFGKAKNIVSSTFPAVIDKPIPREVRAGLKRLVALRKSLEPKIANTLGNKEYAKAVFDRATELAGMTHFPKERYSFYQTWKKKHGGYTPEKVKSMVEGSRWLTRLLSTSTTFREISR